MTTLSLGLRSSGSYGSLQQQQFQNGSLPNQTSPPISSRKPSKMFKDKERLFPWICKFAPRKKVGMLLLCAASAAVFMWVLYVGKGTSFMVISNHPLSHFAALCSGFNLPQSRASVPLSGT